MALFDPNKRKGPRAVREWIGDVYVVDAWSASRDFYDRPRALWVGAGGPALARARRGTIAEDEVGVALAASRARVRGLVDLFATYRQAEELFIVERDDADVSLGELMHALGGERDALPFGLVAHVARAYISAVAAVPVSLDPQHVDVAWDGRVLFRPVHPSELLPDPDEGAYDVVRLAYGVDDRPWRKLACVLYELITGVHPFGATTPKYDPDGFVAMQDRMVQNVFNPLPTHVPEPLKSFVESHLRARAGEADRLLHDPFNSDNVEHFGNGDAAALLRGLFEDKRRKCEIEREERLTLSLSPIRQERWALFSEEE